MLLEELKRGRGDADYASIAQRYFPSAKQFVRQESAKPAAAPKPEPPPHALVKLPGAGETAPAESTQKQPDEKGKPAEETKEPEAVENLSGGIRGWLSRLRRAS